MAEHKTQKQHSVGLRTSPKDGAVHERVTRHNRAGVRFVVATAMTLSAFACHTQSPKPVPSPSTAPPPAFTPTPTPSSTQPPPPSELELVQQHLDQLCGCDEATNLSELAPQAPPRDVSLRDLTTCDARESECHSCFSCFGWQLFFSLNWPANASANAKFGQPGVTTPVVWEAYKSASDVFTTAAPSAWGENTPKAMVATSAVLHLTEALQADNNWLTDRSGNVVYYESRINKDEFDYIVANQLYSQQGLLRAFTSGAGLRLPNGAEAPYHEGAIEVKGAWRVVPEAELVMLSPRYKLSSAMIGKEQKPVTVALIGLHIAKKTPRAPQWVWATFEHEDNAPDMGKADPAKYYNLYDAALTSNALNGTYVPNQSSPPSKFDRPPTPRNRPVQVSRLDPIPDSSRELNEAIRRLIQLRFADSVFQHYQLVNVQWARRPEPTEAKPDAPLPTGSPTPSAVANVAMETYMQEKNSGGGALHVESSSADYGKSSCIGCHSTAAITPTFAKVLGVPAGTPSHWFTDYSALFFRAQKHPN